MEDLLTLTCPACGGSLQVNPRSSVLTCKHCGVEHLVRHGADGVMLESFARCPKCGRNDRVEKVSAILKSHSQELTTKVKRAEEYIDPKGNRRQVIIEVPQTQVQTTGLARSFTSPGPKPELLPKPASIPKPNSLPKPKIKNNQTIKTVLFIFSALALIITLVFFILALIVVIPDPSTENYIGCCSPIIFFGLIGSALLIAGIAKKPLKGDAAINFEKYKADKLQEWNEANLRQIEKWKSANQQIVEKWEEDNRLRQESWQKAMDNWNNLYYCHRDDCVFVEGDQSFAPIEELQSYLYKDSPNRPPVT